MDDYNVARDGAVIAIRLFFEAGKSIPMAEIVTAFGRRGIVRWDSVENRNRYGNGITAYTLYYDERPAMEFADLVRLGQTV